MKIYPITALLAVMLLAMTSCSQDDELLTSPRVQVSSAGTWTDVRDGHSYGVVRIGQQEWLTENLAYYLPTGTVGGSFSWGERENDYKLEDITFLPDTVQITLTRDDYAEVYEATVADPAHDWEAEDKVSQERLRNFLETYFDVYGEEAFTSTMAYYPHFHAALVAGLEARRDGLRAGVLAEMEARCRAIVENHLRKAEASNGGYSQRYGYLYSLDGARAAVPSTGGWRLPTEADWQQLEGALGMTTEEINQMNAWRGAGAGTMLLPGGAAGFGALFGGCNAYLHTNEQQYIRKDQCAYFWTDAETTTEEEQEVESDDGQTSVETFIYRIGTIRQLASYSNAIWRGTTRTDNKYRAVTYSVRLVRDI